MDFDYRSIITTFLDTNTANWSECLLTSTGVVIPVIALPQANATISVTRKSRKRRQRRRVTLPIGKRAIALSGF